MSDDLVKRFNIQPTIAEITAERDDLIEELAVNDALLIKEARMSLERLARAKKAEAERDDAFECNEQFFVDNQFLKKRVEKAEAERDRLREALQVYADPCDESEPSICGFEGNMCCRTARAALKGETP